MIGDGNKEERGVAVKRRNRPLAQPRLKYKPLGDDLLRGLFLFANGQCTQVILGILAAFVLALGYRLSREPSSNSNSACRRKFLGAGLPVLSLKLFVEYFSSNV
jgi:hypothetical protein